MMHYVAMVIGWLEIASLALSIAVYPLLVIAIVRQRSLASAGRQGLRVLTPTAALVSLVGCTAALALVLAVPLSTSWPLLALLLLLGLRFPTDREFWSPALAVFAVMTVLGFVMLNGLSRSVADYSIDLVWLGSRWLIWLAGPRANPSYDSWPVAAGATAALRVGLPAAISLVCSYMAVNRPGLDRLTRLSMVLASAVAAAAAVPSLAVVAISMEVGLVGGVVPIVGGVAALVTTLVLVLILGPGSVASVLVGGRTLGGRLPARLDRGYEAVAGALDVAGDAASGDQPANSISFRTWLIQLLVEHGRRRYLWLGGIMVVFGALTVWSRLSYDYDPQELMFEPVSDEIALDFTVTRVLRAPGTAFWLVGEGRVDHFEPGTGTLTTVETSDRPTVWAHDRGTGALYRLTWDSSTIEVDDMAEPGRPRTETRRVDLGTSRTPRSAVIDGDQLFVAFDDSTLSRWVLGAPAAIVSWSADAPLDLVAVTQIGLLSTRDAPDGSYTILGEHLYLWTDPTTLEPLDSSDIGTTQIEVVDVDGRSVAYGADRVFGQLLPKPGQSAGELEGENWGATRADLELPRMFPTETGVWLLEQFGLSRRLDERAREVGGWWFHYDSVLAILEIHDGGHTWVVARNDQGTVADPGETNTILARVDRTYSP